MEIDPSISKSKEFSNVFLKSISRQMPVTNLIQVYSIFERTLIDGLKFCEILQKQISTTTSISALISTRTRPISKRATPTKTLPVIEAYRNSTNNNSNILDMPTEQEGDVLQIIFACMLLFVVFAVCVQCCR